MRLVMDTLFLEEVEFYLPMTVAQRCRVAPSREEELRQAMAYVGLELIDYDSFTVSPSLPPRSRDRLEPWDMFRVFSKAFRERTERAAAYR